MVAALRFLVVAVLMAVSAVDMPRLPRTSPSQSLVCELTALFKRADTVAVMEIVSGDTESYASAVYKAKVLKL
jgi:hypothetical protein